MASPRLIDRLGAALAAPRAALALVDSEEGAGRAPSDLGILILAGFAAAHLTEIGRAGWLAVDGAAMDGVRLVLAALSSALMAPLLFVIGGGLALTVLAGSRRRPAEDFDMACVAGVPLVAVQLVVELVARFAALPPVAAEAAALASYGWGGWLLIEAWRVTRRRAGAPA